MQSGMFVPTTIKIKAELKEKHLFEATASSVCVTMVQCSFPATRWQAGVLKTPRARCTMALAQIWVESRPLEAARLF